MQIVEITDADVPVVVDFWHRCGLTRPWNDPVSDIAFARGNPSSTILLGRIAERMVASAMIGFDGHRGWIYYLGVDPDLRRQGLGARMMEAAEQWLRARGVPKLQLMIRDGNTAALAFYEALGLERQPVVTMGKRLDSGS
jgi:ribosomal protein S18 acetylase RimI-like enzyme